MKRKFAAVILFMAMTVAFGASTAYAEQPDNSPDTIVSVDFETYNDSASIDKTYNFMWDENYSQGGRVDRFGSKAYKFVPRVGADLAGGINTSKLGLLLNQAYTLSMKVETENVNVRLATVPPYGLTMISPEGDITVESRTNLFLASYNNQTKEYKATFIYTAAIDEIRLFYNGLNSNPAAIYVDDITIAAQDKIWDEDFDKEAVIAPPYTVRDWDSNTPTSEIADSKLRLTMNTDEGGYNGGFLYFRREDMSALDNRYLMPDRDYTFEMKVDTDDRVAEWYIDIGLEGDSSPYPAGLTVRPDNGTVSHWGSIITHSGYNAATSTLSFGLRYTSGAPQFKLTLKSALPSQTDVEFGIDYLGLSVLPIGNGLDIDLTNAKLEYDKGENIDLSGAVVMQKWTNYKEAELLTYTQSGSPAAGQYTVSGYDPSSVGVQTITVESMHSTQTIEVRVKDDLSNLVVTPVGGTDLDYEYGQAFDPAEFAAKLQVTAARKSDPDNYFAVEYGAQDGYTLTAPEFNEYKPYRYEVKAEFGGFESSVFVNVKNPAHNAPFVLYAEDFEGIDTGSYSLAAGGFMSIRNGSPVTYPVSNGNRAMALDTQEGELMMIAGLDKMIAGNAYTFSMKLDFNLGGKELHFDYVDTTDTWHAFGIKADGSVYRVGGHFKNMHNVRYDNVTKQLTFTILAVGGESNRQGNRILLFPQGAGKVTIDDIIIYKAQHVIDIDFNEYTNDSSGKAILSGAYGAINNDNYANQQVSITSDKKLRADFEALSNDSWPKPFLMNNTSPLIRGREYSFQFDFEISNISEWYIDVYYKDSNKYTHTVNGSSITSTAATSASITGNRVSVVFTYPMDADKLEYHVIAKINQGSAPAYMIIDNITLDITPVAHSMTVDTRNAKTVYIHQQDSFDSTGVEALLTLTDYSVQNVSSSVSYTGFDNSSVGDKTISVSHGLSGLSTEYSVKVVKKVKSVSADTQGVATSIPGGLGIKLDGLRVFVTYEDDSQYTLMPDDYTVDVSELDEQQYYTVTVSHIDPLDDTQYIDNFFIYVKTAISIELDTSAVKKAYAYGEALSLEGLIVNIKYSGHEDADLSPTQLSAGEYFVVRGGYDGYKPGAYTIVVMYGDFEQEYSVEVAQETFEADEDVKPLDKDKPNPTAAIIVGAVGVTAVGCGITAGLIIKRKRGKK